MGTSVSPCLHIFPHQRVYEEHVVQRVVVPLHVVAKPQVVGNITHSVPVHTTVVLVAGCNS